jgi:cyclophilin family peptidyl-prolyl cis-trans isomerase
VGDPLSKGANNKQFLGNGGPGYTIPAEFVPGLIHKKGAIAAARLGDEQNPEQASSGSQFYIVQGKVCSLQELQQIEEQRITKMTYKVIRDFLQKPENDALRNQIIALQKMEKPPNIMLSLKKLKLNCHKKWLG